MRKNETARRKGIFGDLFAERQVYLRSGLTSRYVVLSRPLQIGVAIGMGLVIAWLAVASYSSIAKRFEVAGQNRELARLEEANKSLRAAAEAAQATGELRGQAARVPELTASLSAAEAGRERAESLTKAAVDEANELRRQLALAQDRLRELSTAGQATGASRRGRGHRAAASDASNAARPGPGQGRGAEPGPGQGARPKARPWPRSWRTFGAVPSSGSRS